MKQFLLAIYLIVGVGFFNLSAQDSEGDKYMLQGVVMDEMGGLPGATVALKGKATGTVTDVDGTFQLEVTGDETLVVSFVGFESVEMTINQQRNITIQLQTDIQELEEVIITGYGEIRKSDLTGAVGSVKMDDIASLPVSDIGQALQGRIAGVVITPQSGSPGAESDIRVRGIGTITGDASPLYVVDGVVVNNIGFLSQNDIASVEVMKDASVGSLYGARAANGVVVIQTKKGKLGGLKIDVSSQFGVQSLWREPDLMDAREYLILQSLQNGGDVNSFNQLSTRLESAANNDWLNLVSRDGFRQQHSLALSGGTKGLTYRVSTNFYKEEGIIINSDFERLNLLSDIKFDLTDNINVRTNFIYSRGVRNVQAIENRYGLFRRIVIDAPTKRINDEDGFLADTPFRKAKDNVDERTINNLQGKIFFNYKISNEFKFTSRFGFDSRSVDRFRFDRPGTNFDQTLTPNNFGTIKVNENLNEKWLWEQVLSFNKRMDIHEVSVTGAFSLEHQDNTVLTADGESSLGRDISKAHLVNVFRSANLGGDPSAWSQMGAVFRSNYSIAHKYIFQLNMRADGSSRFAKGNRWGLFPSASFGWVLSDDLFPDSQVITGAKLRLSYGVLGNNRIGNYESYTLLTNSINNNRLIYPYGSDENYDYYIGYASQEIGNEGISWERTKSYNLGVDFDLFGHFFFTADAFRRQTQDMLLNVPVPSSVGFSSNPRRNIGEVVNDGLELTTSYKNRFGGLEVIIGGNASYIVNEVTALGDNDDPVFGGTVNNAVPVDMGFVTKTVVGRPIANFYGYVRDGIDEEGFFTFKDLNNDGTIDSNDRTYLGNPIPDFTYGGNIRLAYKQFDMSVFVQGVFGNEIFNVLRYHTHGWNGTNAISGIVHDVWRDPLDFEGVDVPQDILNDFSGANDNVTLPRVTNSDNDNSYRFASDFYVEDGSYFRVKNVQIGYSFGKEALSKLKLDKVRVYASAQNLLTVTNYEGFDPEIGGGGNLGAGIDFGSYPQGRLVLLGIEISL